MTDRKVTIEREELNGAHEYVLRLDGERLGFLDRSTLNYSRVVRFNYGYPVYDLNYRSNVTRLRELVEAEGIHLLGRFAQFDYINSDVCVERALLLAGELRDE